MQIIKVYEKNDIFFLYFFFTVNKIECSWQVNKAFIRQHGIIG